MDGFLRHPLARELTEDSRFYFVHSYRVICDSPVNSLRRAATEASFLRGDRERAMSAGVQFHPEKSHRFGLQLLRNFATS